MVSSSPPETSGPRLTLPTVTLCAAASVNVAATLAALGRSLDRIDFAECLFFTDSAVSIDDARIRFVPIARLDSAEDYSNFIIGSLADYIQSEHCLIVQWDGFVLSPDRWEPGFLEYDYIGAPWPQFDDGHNVGNGGFSLRSRKLLESCRDSRFVGAHPEDVAICRSNRPFLEREHGISFADFSIAEHFSFERTESASPSFGFHGIFNLIPVLGSDEFWEIYRGLDDQTSAFRDYRPLMMQLGSGSKAVTRRARFTLDFLRHLARGPSGRGRRREVPTSIAVHAERSRGDLIPRS